MAFDFGGGHHEDNDDFDADKELNAEANVEVNQEFNVKVDKEVYVDFDFDSNLKDDANVAVFTGSVEAFGDGSFAELSLTQWTTENLSSIEAEAISITL
jgi:hypothetical protein